MGNVVYFSLEDWVLMKDIRESIKFMLSKKDDSFDIAIRKQSDFLKELINKAA